MTPALTADVEVVGVCERLGAAPRPHLGRLPDLVRTVLRCYLLNNAITMSYKRLQTPHSSLHVLHVHVQVHVDVPVSRVHLH